MGFVIRAQQLLYAIRQGMSGTGQALAVDIECCGCAAVAEPVGDFSNAGARSDEQTRMSVAKHVESESRKPDTIQKRVPLPTHQVRTAPGATR